MDGQIDINSVLWESSIIEGRFDSQPVSLSIILKLVISAETQLEGCWELKYIRNLFLMITQLLVCGKNMPHFVLFSMSFAWMKKKYCGPRKVKQRI